MSGLRYRGPIALAIVAVGLLSSRSAHAQAKWYGPPPPSGGLGNAFINGYGYEVLNQAKAEKQLARLQANPDANPRRVDRLRYRIAVDQWLIRKGALCDPGYYPVRHDADCLP